MSFLEETETEIYSRHVVSIHITKYIELATIRRHSKRNLILENSQLFPTPGLLVVVYYQDKLSLRSQLNLKTKVT